MFKTVDQLTSETQDKTDRQVQGVVALLMFLVLIAGVVLILI